MVPRRIRWILAVVLLTALALAMAYPDGFRAAAREAMTHWWENLVPDVFASLLVVHGILWLVPEWEPLAPMLQSLAGFPLIGGFSALRQSPAQSLPARLAWTNLYNPLLFAHPWHGLILDACLAAGAWITTGPPPLAHTGGVHSPHPVTTSMNATTVLGAYVLAGHLLAATTLPLSMLTILDPLIRGTQSPVWWNRFWLGMNGMALFPLAIEAGRRGMPLRALISPRLISALFAGMAIIFLP